LQQPMPGYVAEVVDVDVAGEKLADERGVDDAWVQQRLAKRSSARQRCPVTLRQTTGDQTSQRGSVCVQAAAGHEDDLIARDQGGAEDRLVAVRDQPDRAPGQL